MHLAWQHPLSEEIGERLQVFAALAIFRSCKSGNEQFVFHERQPTLVGVGVAVACEIHFHLTPHKCCQYVGYKAKVALVAAHKRKQYGSLPYEVILLARQVEAEVLAQYVAELVVEQARHLPFYGELLLESVCVERKERFVEHSEAVLQFLELLGSIFALQFFVVSEHTLWQQPQKSVARETHFACGLVNAHGVAVVIAEEGSFVMDLPPLFHFRIEMAEQHFCPYLR